MPRSGTLDVAAAAGDAARRVCSLDAPTWEMPDAQFLQINWEVDDAGALDLTPPSLHPSIPPFASFFAGHFPESPVGPFSIVQVRLVVRAGIRPRGAVPRRGVRLARRRRRAARPLGLPGAARRGRVSPSRHDQVRFTAALDGRDGRRLRRAHRRRHQRQRPDDVRQPPPGAPRRRRRPSWCRSTRSTRSTRPTAAGPRCRSPIPQALGMRGVAAAGVADHRLHVPRRHRPRAGPLHDRRRRAGAQQHQAHPVGVSGPALRLDRRRR